MLVYADARTLADIVAACSMQKFIFYHNSPAHAQSAHLPNC